MLKKEINAGFVFSIQESIKKNILELETDKKGNLSRSVIKQLTTR